MPSFSLVGAFSGRSTNGPRAASRGARAPCRFWFGSSRSCRNGSQCGYSHDAVAEPQSPRRTVSKTPCRSWTGLAGSCRYGESCHFVHDGATPSSASSAAPSPGSTAASSTASPNGQSPALLLPPLPPPPAALTNDAKVGARGITLYTTTAVPWAFTHALYCEVKKIQRDSGAAIYYDPDSEKAIVTGSIKQTKIATARIEALVEEASERQSAECCVCLEAPGKAKDARGRPGRYGILEGCDHIVCMSCIMQWRQNEEIAREARLGCPVCRTLSHIIVPWPASALGDERLKIVEQHKERCRVTPCKWSSNGMRCPAGKHCIYNHDLAPQVSGTRVRKPDSRSLVITDLTELLVLSGFVADDLLGVGESDDDVEQDEEILAGINALAAESRARRFASGQDSRARGRDRGRFDARPQVRRGSRGSRSGGGGADLLGSFLESSDSDDDFRLR